MVNNLNKDLISDDSKFLNEFLRGRIPIFVKYMQEACKNSKDLNKCSIQEFSEGIRKFVIPAKYQEDEVLANCFNECKENPEDIKINYKNLINRLIDTKDENNFFNFKDVSIFY